MPSPQRTLSELCATDEPAWPLVQEWVAKAPSVQVLPADPAQAGQVLVRAQVSLRSPLGAVVFHTGGILIGDGWLRILGSGHPRLPRSLSSWNDGRAPTRPDGVLGLVFVADDVLGGLFAINGGAISGNLGEVFYLAPDTLQWESLGLGYTDFVAWALTPNLDLFYRDQRWAGWRDEILAMNGDQGLVVYPFLWAEGPPIGERSRKVVPMSELFDVTMDMARQLSG